MKDDNQACKIRLCPERKPPRPINLSGDPPPDDSGFLVVRFKASTLDARHGDLAAAAKQAGLKALMQLLDTFRLSSRPLITSIKPDVLERIEKEALGSELHPLQSLSTYWRLDVRHTTQKPEEIEAALRRLPEVELVYREKTPSDPVNAGDDTYAGTENFLDAAPTGIDARWVWTQPNGDGAGMHFIDLEQGWLLGHEDLPSPTLLFNDNHDGVGGYVGLLLLGAFFMAVGLMASSFTRNQIVAALISLAVCLFIYFIGQFVPLLPTALIPFFEYISISYHFDSIARGVIDTRVFIFYATLTAACLLITQTALQSRRWR